MINNVMKPQKGLSLIELMIAIALSIFIVAAMISLFVNSKQNYRMNENMSRMQENARFAMSFISRDVRMADYHACVPGDRLSTAISGQDNTTEFEGHDNQTDSITVVWQANDCVNSVTMEYLIKIGDSEIPALFRSIDGGDDEELVEGIWGLEILYGEDTSGNNVPDRYVSAGSVTEMEDAISVRITLTAGTMESNFTTAGGRIFRDFTSTVTLRNRLP